MRLGRSPEGAVRTGRVAGALGLILLVAVASALTVCDLLFGCGCEPAWAEGAAHCDITIPGPPDCPNCASGLARGAAVASVIAAGVVATVVSLARRTRMGLLSLVAAGTLAYLAGAVVTGAVLAAIDGNDRFGAVVRSLPPPQHPEAR